MQTPALYLDPLLPLTVAKCASSARPVAGTDPAVALLICASGTVEVRARGEDGPLGRGAASDAAAPGRVQLGSSDRPGRPRASGAVRRAITTVAAPALAWWRCDEWRTIRRTAAGGSSGDDSGHWLVVLGAPLIEQVIVASFGEAGFVSFLEGFTQGGGAKTGSFDAAVTDALEHLSTVLENRPPAYRVLARSLVTEVLLGTYQAGLAADAALPTAAYGLSELLDYIEANYSHALRLEDLAAMMETSPSHLSRLFTRQVGMPLFEYINRVRVRKASLLLRKTTMSVMEVAIDVGYNNVSFFNRYFRRIMRVSPREYRSR